MTKYFLCTICLVLGAIMSCTAESRPQSAHTAGLPYDVREFGAKGDGRALDSPAINGAIDAAAQAGGGTVWLGAGTYRCTSIHLKSHVDLRLEQGATILAADHDSQTAYDIAEPAINDTFQDYGHSHFHNSLIWGENLTDVSIEGPGQIWGKGLVRDQTKDPKDGNKSISLRDCSKVVIRDLTIRHGGWFCLLATGIDHMTIDNVIMDTNRDGMDVDCCRDVHITKCSVNSPNDDAIVLKSSFALGEARVTENVTISDCLVSGFQEGSFLDRTYVRRGRTTGRIKFGTESNGGFKNIAISNCVFDWCGGFALETVDGAQLEDVTVSNVTMRDISNSPFFLRLGRRMRGPAGSEIGTLRRVSFSNIRVVRANEASIVAGIPGHPIENVSFNNIRISTKGGAPAVQAEVVPKEQEAAYPEPGSFGKMPSHGFFVRHARNVVFHDVDVSTDADDARPAFVLDDVDGADLTLVGAHHGKDVPAIRLKGVRDLQIRMVNGLRDRRYDHITGRL